MMSVASSTTPGNRRELVQNAFDLYCSDGGAFDRGQQNTPQRIADSRAETAFERLCGKLRVTIRWYASLVDNESFRFLKTFPKHLLDPPR